MPETIEAIESKRCLLLLSYSPTRLPPYWPVESAFSELSFYLNDSSPRLYRFPALQSAEFCEIALMDVLKLYSVH